MRSLTILAAFLMIVMFGTPVRADHKYQSRNYHHQHHSHYRSSGHSYPSVVRYGGRNFGWYPRPLYGFGHPYYYGVSVAGPIHPLYGPGFYQPYFSHHQYRSARPYIPYTYDRHCDEVRNPVQIIVTPRQSPVIVP